MAKEAGAVERIQAREFGKYVLYALVGKGGMAEVYFGLGESGAPGEFVRFVAVKKILPHISQNRLFVDNLIQEAKIGVLLEHPNIVEVYDLGAVGGEFFIAMAFVQGKDLAAFMKRVPRFGEVPRMGDEVPAEGKDVGEKLEKKPFDDRIALFIGYQVLSGLHCAHTLKDVKGNSLNIVHRDISPGNILCSYRGDVKIVDFGVASSELHREQSIPMFAAGKVFYMSPEQLRSENVNCQSDLYGVGVLFFEMLTGRRPIEASDMAMFQQKIESNERLMLHDLRPDLPDAVVVVIEKALEQDPTRRYETAAAFGRALGEAFKACWGEDLTDPTVYRKNQGDLASCLHFHFNDAIASEIFLNQEALEDFKRRRERGDARGIEREPVFKSGEAELIASSIGGHAGAQEMGVVQQWDKALEGAVPPEGGEATVLQLDVGNEATRAFYLNSQERKAILQDANASDPLSDLSSGLSVGGSVISDFEWTSSTPFDESTNRLAKNKQRISSKVDALSLPAVDKTEIQNWLSGEPVSDVPGDGGKERERETTGRGKASVLKNSCDETVGAGEAIDVARTLLREPVLDAGGGDETSRRGGKVSAEGGEVSLSGGREREPKVDWREREAFSMRIVQEVKRTSERWSRSEPNRTTRFVRVLEKTSVQTIVIGLFLVGLVSLLSVMIIRSTLSPSETSNAKLLPPFPKVIDVVLITEGDPTSDRAFFESVSGTTSAPVAGTAKSREGGAKAADTLKTVEIFFGSEYQRYTGKNEKPIRFDVKGPIRTPKRLSSRSMILDILGGYSLIDIFSTAAQNQGVESGKSGRTIFVYFHPFQSGDDGVVFPIEYGKKRENGIGVVYFPMDRRYINEGVFSITHEVGHVFGASDKYDIESGRPLPWGVVEPDRGYEQQFAELMARTISVTQSSTKAPESLDYVKIGASTAKELGWTK